MANENNDQGKRQLKKPRRERTPGEVIVAARKEYNWSREYLEQVSGISVSQLGRIERGVADPGYETIEKLETALGIELFDLFMEYRDQGEAKKRKAESAGSVGGKGKPGSAHRIPKNAAVSSDEAIASGGETFTVDAGSEQLPPDGVKGKEHSGEEAPNEA